MDCLVHGVAKSRTRLSDFHYHSHDCGVQSIVLYIVLYQGLLIKLLVEGHLHCFVFRDYE